MRKSIWIVACLMTAAVLGAGGCQKKGPFEQAGEEIDEAAHTIKNGGKETTADKVDDKLDDAADTIRDGVKSEKQK